MGTDPVIPPCVLGHLCVNCGRDTSVSPVMTWRNSDWCNGDCFKEWHDRKYPRITQRGIDNARKEKLRVSSTYGRGRSKGMADGKQ